MHKCDDLPPFEENHVECAASIESGLKNGTDCINWNMYYSDCRPGERNPFHGAISFDNIGLAWVAIFLVRMISHMRVILILINRSVYSIFHSRLD